MIGIAFGLQGFRCAGFNCYFQWTVEKAILADVGKLMHSV